LITGSFKKITQTNVKTENGEYFSAGLIFEKMITFKQQDEKTAAAFFVKKEKLQRLPANFQELQ